MSQLQAEMAAAADNPPEEICEVDVVYEGQGSREGRARMRVSMGCW